MLQAHILAVELNMQTDHLGKYPKDEMIWDQYCPIYEKLVTLAETIFATPEPNSKEERILPRSFTLDIGLMSIFHDLTRRCRDPKIRRRAIHVLRTSNRQEGLMTGISVARIAQKIMDIEEANLGSVESCAQIPVWARISDVHLMPDLNGGKIYFSYRRFQDSSCETKDTLWAVVKKD